MKISESGMIDRKIFDQVVELQNLAVAPIEIKKRTGASKSTVRKILQGKHFYQRPLQDRPETDLVYPKLPKNNGTYEKCPICDRKVISPCFACQINELLKKTGIKGFDTDRHINTLEMGIDLVSPHKERYEEIRAAKENDGLRQGAVSRNGGKDARETNEATG